MMEDMFMCLSILICICGWSASFLEDRTGRADIDTWIDYGRNQLYKDIEERVYQHPHLKKIIEKKKEKQEDEFLIVDEVTTTA
jgi:hypothetical protein